MSLSIGWADQCESQAKFNQLKPEHTTQDASFFLGLSFLPVDEMN